MASDVGSERTAVIPVFWHSVDPQPEQAYPYPNTSFFEIQGRIESILQMLRTSRNEQFDLNELGMELLNLESAKKYICAVHSTDFFDWLRAVYADSNEPVVADIMVASKYRTRLPQNGRLAHLAGFWGYDSWTPVVRFHIKTFPLLT